MVQSFIDIGDVSIETQTGRFPGAPMNSPAVSNGGGPAVLVVGQSYDPDPCTDLVVAALHRRGVPVFGINPTAVATRYSGDSRLPAPPPVMAAHLCGPEWTGRLRVHTVVIGGDGEQRDLDLTAISGVYYRRPDGYADDPGLTVGEYREHAVDQAMLGVSGILPAATGSWLNDPHRSSHAEHTPVQLRAAQDAGLRIPRTCITDTPAVAKQFIATVGDTVRKPLRGRGIADDDGDLADDIIADYIDDYAPDLPRSRHRPPPSPITPDDCDDRIHGTVHLLQQRIPVDHEVRITIVDDVFFPARLDPGNVSTHYRPTAVPTPIRHATTALLRRLGLRTMSADFVIDDSGRWWFLGCNPHSGWARVQHDTGLPIADALADALRKPLWCVADQG